MLCIKGKLGQFTPLLLLEVLVFFLLLLLEIIKRFLPDEGQVNEGSGSLVSMSACECKQLQLVNLADGVPWLCFTTVSMDLSVSPAQCSGIVRSCWS